MYPFSGLVRQSALPYYQDASESRVGMNPSGQLSVAQGLPAKADLVRMGQTWSRAIPTGSHFTHVAAWPTTRAELVLKNGEAAGGKSYVLDSAWAVNDATSIAAAACYTLLGQIVASHATAVTDNTAILTWSHNGRATSGGLSQCAVANTTYGIASRWQPLPSPQAAGPAVTPGLGAFAELYGYFILPPGSIFLLNLIVGTATGTSIAGITWHEVQLPVVA